MVALLGGWTIQPKCRFSAQPIDFRGFYFALCFLMVRVAGKAAKNDNDSWVLDEKKQLERLLVVGVQTAFCGLQMFHVKHF